MSAAVPTKAFVESAQHGVDQDIALCCAGSSSSALDNTTLQDAFLKDLSATMANYDERFLSSLKQVPLLASQHMATSPKRNTLKRKTESSTTSHELLLGIKLFQSLIDVVSTENDATQRRIVLDQSTHLLTAAGPLTLLDRTKSGASAGCAVDALRGFLLQMALPSQTSTSSSELTIRDLSGFGTQFSAATTALVRLASARGRASDLLHVVYVLLRAGLCSIADHGARPVFGCERWSCDSAVSTRKNVLRKELEKAQKMKIRPASAAAAVAKATGCASSLVPCCSSSSVAPANNMASATSSSESPAPQLLLRQVWASKAQMDQANFAALAKQLESAQPQIANLSPRLLATKTSPKTAASRQKLSWGSSSGMSEVWSCGQNSYGELAHGDSTARNVYKRIDSLLGINVVQVAAGNEHTVVLTTEGKVLTSGYNDNGQCGHGTLQSVTHLQQIGKLEGSMVTQVHAYNGCEHTLVTLQDGRLASFGYNYRGQLGLGNTTSQSVPRSIRALEGRQVILVSCSYHHTVVACKQMEVFSFGRNDSGQLGVGDTTDRKSPELVQALCGEIVTSVACGQYHTCVLRRDGQILACGKNDYGQLGVGATEPVVWMTTTFPQNSKVFGMSRVKLLRCGYYHTVALTESGKAYGYGRNDYGQLGLGHQTQRVYGPKPIETVDHIVTVAAGCYHTILVGEEGMLYVMGRNNHGQIGTGDTADRHSPHAIDKFFGKRIVSVAAGFYHTIVVSREIEAFEKCSSLQTESFAPPYSATSVLKRQLPCLFDELNQDNFTDQMLSPSSDNRAAKSSVAKSNAASNVRNIDVAIFVVAHMDRLISAAFPPREDVCATSPSARQLNELQAAAASNSARFAESEQSGSNQRLYCVDATPDMFEFLLRIFITVFSSEHSASDRTNGTYEASRRTHDENEVSSSARPPRSFSLFEFQYTLLALLRILKVNIEYLLYLEARDESIGLSTIAICRGDHVSMPHANIYERFLEEDDDLQVPRKRASTSRDDAKKRLWEALRGLQHQLMLILQAPATSGSGSDLVQLEAAEVLLVGIDLFYPCQIHQAQLVSELLAIEHELLPRPSPRNAVASLALNGRTQAKRRFLHKLLQRFSSDDAASHLIPCDNTHTRYLRDKKSCTTHTRVQKAVLTLSETLVKSIIFNVEPITSLTTTPLSRCAGSSGSRSFFAPMNGDSIQDLLRHALLALQRQMLLWVTTTISDSPSRHSAPSEFKCGKDDGLAMVAAVCGELRSQVSQTPSSLRCLADYAEMIVEYSLEVTNGYKANVANSSGVDLFSTSQTMSDESLYSETSAPRRDPQFLKHLQESVVGLVLHPLIVGLLPFPDIPYLATRLLKPVTRMVQTFDRILQQMFVLKASSGEEDATRRIHQQKTSYDFHKLAWLQDLTKTSAILAGRLAGVIFASDAWLPCVSVNATTSSSSNFIERWCNSPMLANGFEKNCVSIIERQGVLPDSEGLTSTTNQGSLHDGETYTPLYGSWKDVATAYSAMLEFLRERLSDEYSTVDQAYSMVIRQIHRQGGTQQKTVADFEHAVLAILLKRNDLLCQGELLFTKRRGTACWHVPQRFLAIWRIVARATMWLWSTRSTLRGSNEHQSNIDDFLCRAIHAARTLFIFADDKSEKSRMLSYVPKLYKTRHGRSKLVATFCRAIAGVRSVLRWKRLYWRSSGDVRIVLKSVCESSGLECVNEIVDFVTEASEISNKSANKTGIYRLISTVVHSYHRAYWRKAGIETFHELMRSLETQSSKACVLYCLTQSQEHPHIQGHFLHLLAATGSEIRIAVEESYVLMCREITGIIHHISCRNGYVRTPNCSAQPTILGAAEAQLLLVALNALGWKYTRSDWRYINRIDVVKVLHSVVESLDIAYSTSESRRNNSGRMMSDYSSQMRSLLPKPMVGGMSNDSTQGKKCLQAAWNLLRLLVQSASSDSLSHTVTSYGLTEAVEPVYDVLYSIAKRALIKLDARNKSLASEDESDLLDSGCFRPTSPTSCTSQGDTEAASPKGNTQRRCQELVTTAVQFKNLELGIHIASDRIITNSSEGSDDFSIMFWVFVSQRATGHHRIMFASGTADKWMVVLLRDVDMRLEVGIAAPGSSRILTDRVVAKNAVSLNQWTHVGLVSEGAKLKIYIDGALDQKSNCNTACASGQQMYFGKLPDGLLPLDGVRGGLEGAIAKLRYYTRALSPIHVRILCDQGAPLATQDKDAWCGQICALLHASSQSRSTRLQLSQPKWLELLFNMIVFGTSRVQLAINRILRGILPSIAPEKVASLHVRHDWFEIDGKPGSRRQLGSVSVADCVGGDPQDQIFVKAILDIVGLSLWRVENPIDSSGWCLRKGPSSESFREETYMRRMVPLLPCNLLSCYTSPFESNEEFSFEKIDFEDPFPLASELISLLKAICRNGRWRHIIQEVASAILQGCSREDTLEDARKLAVLSVLGGDSEAFRPGARAVTIKTNTEVCIIGTDDTLCLAHVVRTSSGSRFQEVVRMNKSELKLLPAFEEAHTDHDLLGDKFSVVPSVLKTFEESAAYCLQEGARKNPTRDWYAMLVNSRHLAQCIKILCRLSTKEEWVRNFQDAKFMETVLRLAKTIIPLTSFDDLDRIEEHAVKLRNKLYKAQSTEFFEPSIQVTSGETNQMNAFKSGIDDYENAMDAHVRSLCEDREKGADSWISQKFDAFAASKAVQGQSTVPPDCQIPSPPSENYGNDEDCGSETNSEIFSECYFATNAESASTGRCPSSWNCDTGCDAHESFEQLELISVCCQAEISLAIVYARLYFLSAIRTAGSPDILPRDLLVSSTSILRLLKLFVFRGAPFSDASLKRFDTITSVVACKSNSNYNEAIVLEIFACIIHRALPSSADGKIGRELLAHCLLVFEAAATARSLRPVSWYHRELRCPDSDAVVRPNIEFAYWLLNKLQDLEVDGAFEIHLFIRLVRCFQHAKSALRLVVAEVLSRIVRRWLGDVGKMREFLRCLFIDSTMMTCLRMIHQRRLTRERAQKRLCLSPYLCSLSELLLSLIDLERMHVRCDVNSAEISEMDIVILSPRLCKATSDSLQLEWPSAMTKRGEAPLACIYELQIADAVTGMDVDEEQYRVVFRGSRREAVVEGLVPLRSYTFRVAAIVHIADDVVEVAGPSVQMRTLTGPVFMLDKESCGENIAVSDDGLTATYTGNEAWSMILGNEPLVAGCNQWEISIENSPTSCIFVGVATRFADVSTFLGGDDHSWGYIGDRALYHKRMKVKVYGERYSMGDIVGVTLDMNHGVLSFAKNGFDLGIAFDGLAGELYPAIAFYNKDQRVSVKSSSYRCPGVGDRIPRMHRAFYGIDELEEYSALMRSLASSASPPKKWQKRAFKWYNSWYLQTGSRHPTFAGTDILVDASKEACRAFGTSAGEFIQISRGRARVAGVAAGLLWYYLEGQSRAWFLTPSEAQRLKALGYLHSVNPTETDTPTKTKPLSWENFTQCLAAWTLEADAAIISIINEVATQQRRTSSSSSSSPWNLRPAQLLSLFNEKPRVCEMVAKAATEAPDGVSLEDIFLCRVALLFTLNNHLEAAFPFASHGPWNGRQRMADHDDSSEMLAQTQDQLIDRRLPRLSTSDPARTDTDTDQKSFTNLLRATRELAFTETKQSIFRLLVKRTKTHAKQVEDDYDYPEDLPQLSLNRLAAMAERTRKDSGKRLAHSIFGQLFESLHFLDPKILRMGYTHPMDDAQERAFKVKFEGEGVDDYGGPFREIFVQTPLEMQSPDLPLLLPAEDDKFVPVPQQPACKLHLEMFSFVGKLIGIALRCKVTMQLDFPSRMWKFLVDEPLKQDDVAEVAEDIFTKVDHALEQLGDGDEVTELNWTTTLSDGKEIDVRPDGHRLEVIVEHARDFVRCAINARLTESRDAQLSIRDGLELIIPRAILRVLTGVELESMVCGLASVDLELLRRNTEYDDDICPDDEHIRFFWEALHSFDGKDRASFLRFVWARTRLPEQQHFHQKFKIQTAVGEGASADPDKYLPKAHTCFFSINLPKYSSVQIMAEKIKYAMHNTVEMDADFRLADNEMVRWFDHDDNGGEN